MPANADVCQHCRTRLDVTDPILTEEDVPGSQIAVMCAQNYKVDQLRRWLITRNLPIGGRKEDLVKR